MSESDRPWDAAWFDQRADRRMAAWRGVENQSESTTLRLVDSREEHDELEAMLEASKPPLPPECAGLHWLLFTPFRYVSPQGTRFRAAGEAGVWYGADSVHTACAELAYWRHRFIGDSVGLTNDDSELVTSHTFFKAQVAGDAIDLASARWSSRSAAWTHPDDYATTQRLAREARSREIEWIRYAAVRHPGGHCAAVLCATALARTAPSDYQQWHCRTTRQRVMFSSRERGTGHSWDF